MAFNSENLYMNRAKFILKLFGVWVPPDNDTFYRKLHRTFTLILQFSFLLFEIIYMFQVLGDLEAVSQASYVLFTEANLCFKVTVFLVNRKLVKELLSQMNSEVFSPQSEEQKKWATRIKRLLLAFMMSSQGACCLWALKPMFDDAGSRTLPFAMWVPTNAVDSPQYELWYIYQAITGCMSAYIYFGVDSVPFSMVMFGTAQINVIKNKILSIESLSNELGHTKPDIDRQIIQSNNYKILVECVKQHQAIIVFEELVEKTFHSYLFFQLTGSVAIICMSAILILVIEWQSMQFLAIVMYLMCMIIQIYVCCWCGHELTATSVEFHTTLYNNAWYEQDVKFKRALCFVMMRASRPILLRAGHYITLSRQTFVTILRMSYSYFAVLNQTI